MGKVKSMSFTYMHFRPVRFQKLSLLNLIHHGAVMLSRGERLLLGSVKSGQNGNHLHKVIEGDYLLENKW